MERVRYNPNERVKFRLGMYIPTMFNFTTNLLYTTKEEMDIQYSRRFLLLPICYIFLSIPIYKIFFTFFIFLIFLIFYTAQVQQGLGASVSLD